VIGISIICYFVATLVIVAALVFIGLFFKRTHKKMYISHAFIGAGAFFLVVIGMFILFMYAFSKQNTEYINALMPEWIYKTSIVFIYFAVVGIIRYFALNCVYFNNCKTDKGISFIAGYGIAGGVVVALYCFIMMIHILITSISSELLSFDGTIFCYDSGARISVLTPFVSHIYVALVFTVYAGLMLVISLYMEQHAALPYKPFATFKMYIITHGSELLIISIFLFLMSKISALAIALICVVIVALAATALVLLYKYKEELPYSKQFD